MTRTKITKKMLSLLLCMAMLITYVPLVAVSAADENAFDRSIVSGITVDPGTADSWESMLGTGVDGNRYAGRVWVDKSVYKNGDTVVLNSRGEAGSSFEVVLEEDEAFQIVFSALGSTMTTQETITSSGPMDVVLVFDTSTSMDDTDSNGVTRLERTITAANELLKDLLTIKNVRIAIVTYNNDSETVLPLASYTNGVKLVVNNYFNNNRADAGVVYAYDNDDNLLGKDDGYTSGTNLQSGIDRSFNILANASDVEGRMPVAIVLTDGQANRASQAGFYELSSHSDKDGTGASNRNLYLSTLLNAAYNKTKIEAHYGKEASVYTVGVDITSNVTARLLVNPADGTNGFNSRNTSNEVKRAYENFRKWANGENVTYSGWTFDHNYPTQGGLITDAKIAANINYSDSYYDVSNSELGDAFKQIYEELSSGVFNPISSSTSVGGATGVDDTPLLYVDFIGQYMEIKEIQSVSLFGASYGVVKNADGTYRVNAASGINPTTNESWKTDEDILISVIEQADGTQKLEIRINQEILPIIMEQVISETVGGATNATITEYLQAPLRVYYTVGMDSDILLPNGKVDVSKIQGYEYIDDAEGTVSFYSNRFGVSNPASPSGVVSKGDAHVGFQPSAENRYYYHQSNQGIFTKITDKTNGSIVTIPESNEYGIVWDEAKYELSRMTYDEYLQMEDDTRIYTYVTYYHPTPSATDAANAAEEVTYLVYTDWAYLKDSVTFYDETAESYLAGGAAIRADQVEATVTAYLQSNPSAKLYAVLGVGSHRTSRLHNMMLEKTANNTQTAVERYTPEYTFATAAQHNGNSVVVWLGNNGKLTVEIETGIALTKEVTEAIGDANDTYALTVTVPSGVTADPVVSDADGNLLPSTYIGNVLTVNVKAGETVYVSGIPGGTQCLIDEIIDGDYYIVSKTDKVTVPMVSEALNGAPQFASAVVTNAPYKYGSLFITKEITSDHTVPTAVLDTSFYITVNVGAALAGETFTVRDSTHGSLYDVTVDNSGDLLFQIKARQTIEILKLPHGTAVTVTEAAPGSHFAVSYRTRNHSGETADADNAVVIPADGSATAVVLNHYTPAPVSVDLDIVGTKTFIAEGSHPGGAFVYKVQQWNGTAWVDLDGKTAQTPYSADETGVKTFLIEDVLSDVVYTQVGNHAYQVVEVKGDVANVTYDRTLYSFDVSVTDNGGQLVAAVTDLNNTAITDGSYEVSFTNTYHTAPVSVDITKIVENKSGDDTVSMAGFVFKAVRTDANWNALTGAEASRLTVFSDAAGQARFAATCTSAGTYYYLLTEENAAAPGWSYSSAEYRITVTVTENSGDLRAELTIVKAGSQNAQEIASVDASDATKGSVSFVNTYTPKEASVDLDGAVVKELSGMALQADQFTFYVYKNDDRTSPVLVGTNGLGGNVGEVDFDQALHFDRVGKYEYDIVEAIPNGAVYDAASGKYVLNGMSYDPTIFDLVVEVTNNSASGELEIDYYFEDSVDNVVTFRNSYKAAPTTYTLGGQKILHGRAIRGGEFSFALFRDGSLLETAISKADGSFAFGTITYTEAGVYTYTVSELVGDVAGVRYDGASKPVTVTVTVTDVNGTLVASADVNNADIRFENTYTANTAQVTFGGIKELAGGNLTDNAFTFKLYQTDLSFDITHSSASLLETVQNVDGAFSFARTLSDAGTYYFVIVEDATDAPMEGIVYDRTQYQFAVNVSDNGYGQLLASVTNMRTGVTTASAASVTTGVVFTNATFDQATEKEVYLADNVSTEIDGKKVNAGDILTYFITYTNYTGENVVVDIMDTIPEYTSYVEGTASHGGTYAGTHLNWIINLDRGESVTVSFDVRVNETKAIVANTAVVRDGVNTYKTNEVVNYTYDHPVEKDVFSPADPTVSIDGKKVYEGDELLYKITYTNLTGKSANVTITDAIPANTTYVADSADNGGVYENGTVVWELADLPAWSTVTVAFKVTVNTDVGATVIENKAMASEGTNTYETRTVTNYTVEDPVSKDVFYADNVGVSIDGEKVYAGDELIYAITYENTAEEAVSVVITDTIPANTTYVADSADNSGVYANGVITWTLDVATGETVTVTFAVTVDDVGAVTIPNSASVVEGKNTYSTNEVSNYTVVDEVSKNVFMAEDPTVTIDGGAVNLGDRLMYVITYKNTSSEKATVVITDAIPQYTLYVEGSADNGGVYAEGVITWTLEVEAGQEVAVSFCVEVEGISGVSVTNQATVVAGKNTYTTNEVTTTVNVPAEPDVPPTGDNETLYLWFVILFVSGGGLIVTMACKRRNVIKQY